VLGALRTPFKLRVPGSSPGGRTVGFTVCAQSEVGGGEECWEHSERLLS
jgi:hypothetical protein